MYVMYGSCVTRLLCIPPKIQRGPVQVYDLGDKGRHSLISPWLCKKGYLPRVMYGSCVTCLLCIPPKIQRGPVQVYDLGVMDDGLFKVP